MKVIAINGSPRMEKGYTALILTPFIEGMTDAGAEVKLFYPRRLKIKPCTCGQMYCWYGKSGECCIKDDMQLLYPQLREADILALAESKMWPSDLYRSSTFPLSDISGLNHRNLK